MSVLTTVPIRKAAADGNGNVPAAATSKPAITMNYWARRRKASEYLSWFFGQRVSLDVSVNEVQTYGLAALLQSNVPLCYFLYYLLENYCSENLFFFIEVEYFESHKFKNREDMRRTARQLYHSFIREKSDFEVNLDARISKPIKKAIESFDQSCFYEAKMSIFHLLEPSFVQFKISPTFRQMEEELGSGNTIYTKEQRDLGVQILLKHLDKSLTSEETGIRASDAAIKAERTRARLVRSLVHSFCKTRLNCDFWDKDEGKNLDEIKPADILAQTREVNPF